MPLNISYTIEDELSEKLRLDRYISENLKLFSRSQIKSRNLKAKLNGKEIKFSRLVKPKDILELTWEELPPIALIPEDIPLEIVYEDDNCIVINKQQGLVVHPGAGNRQGTLANALCYRRLQRGEAQVTGIRPGIVHRLDKETSGIIIAAWNEKTHAALSEQFKTRQVKKLYLAIVCGIPKETKGRIETFIARDSKNRKKFAVSPNGKHAITLFKILKQWKNHSFVLLRLKTGRTHQLRVHLRHIGCPILGDSIYGIGDKQFPGAGLMLHSKSLAITLPEEAEQRVFLSALPQRFIDIIEKLNNIEGVYG
ncbi:MAG: RluA family pseudouridine synthase [Treponema sp.]|nr:RluA family pseudouridine synthase [Treponema sp.]